MALAFYVDGHNKHAFAEAFAAHDEYLAMFSYFVHDQEAEPKMLMPNHDYYSAPFCFLPKSATNGFLVFTHMVPWLTGNPVERDNRDREDERPHDLAWRCQNRDGKFDAPHIGTAEGLQRRVCLKEEDVITFTKDGGYPTKEDVSQALGTCIVRNVIDDDAFYSLCSRGVQTCSHIASQLLHPPEDQAVKVTCTEMGWRFPAKWRYVRKEIQVTHDLPLLDLADWDRQQEQQQCKGTMNNSANASTANAHGNANINANINENANNVPCNNNNNVNDGGKNCHVVPEEEEKKDSTEEYLC